MFSNTFLKRCEELQRAGYFPELRPGILLGRGFADLGSEVFCLLPNNKLVSLFTGAVRELSNDELHQLFHVPTVDEAVDELLRRRYEIAALVFRDQREWELELRSLEHPGAAPLRSHAASLEETFLEALHLAYEEQR